MARHACFGEFRVRRSDSGERGGRREKQAVCAREDTRTDGEAYARARLWQRRYWRADDENLARDLRRNGHERIFALYKGCGGKGKTDSASVFVDDTPAEDATATGVTGLSVSSPYTRAYVVVVTDSGWCKHFQKKNKINRYQAETTNLYRLPVGIAAKSATRCPVVTRTTRERRPAYTACGCATSWPLGFLVIFARERDFQFSSTDRLRRSIWVCPLKRSGAGRRWRGRRRRTTRRDDVRRDGGEARETLSRRRGPCKRRRRRHCTISGGGGGKPVAGGLCPVFCAQGFWRENLAPPRPARRGPTAVDEWFPNRREKRALNVSFLRPGWTGTRWRELEVLV